MTAEFESAYPIHLSGIISPDEFQQSINNINEAISSRKSLIIFGIFASIFLFGGFVLFFIGGISSVTDHTSGFPLPVAVGIGLFIFGMLGCICGCVFLHEHFNGRMQKAIAHESMKYSARLPIPCSWRLDARTTWVPRYGSNATTTTYRVS